MILTCGTCGHRGEDGKDYAHDCYWVFRERGQQAYDVDGGHSTNPEPTKPAIQKEPSPSASGEALRALVLAVQRVAFTHRWANESGSWSGKLSPDEALLMQAVQRAEAALAPSGEAHPVTVRDLDSME
jgi:hypothetical protein